MEKKKITDIAKKFLGETSEEEKNSKEGKKSNVQQVNVQQVKVENELVERIDRKLVTESGKTLLRD